MTRAGCVGLLALLGIAGCAQTATNTATPAAAARPEPSPEPSSEGTVLSMRPVAVRSNRDPWRVALLADASGAATGVADGGAPMTEFIVRIDGGSTISVVQTNELGIRPGDRVTIMHDGHTRIARPG